MKTLKLICLPLLIVTGAVVSVCGEQFRTDINPALLYNQAFIVAPDLSQTDKDYLFGTNDWRGQKLPERFGELVARYNAQFRLVSQAAGATVPCDWGIDLSLGPNTLLPHLPRAKTVAQVARLRAMWDLQNGRTAEARADLLAAFGLGRNVSRDSTLIGGLVQIAIEKIIVSTVAENFYQFTPGTLKQLIDGFDVAPARGTMAACIPAEKSFPDWLVGNILELQKAHPGNDTKVMEGTRELFARFEDTPENQTDPAQPSLRDQVLKRAGGTSEGVIKLLVGMNPEYARLAEIMALPHGKYEDQMQQFSAEIHRSSNPFVASFFPALEKCRSKEFEILVELAMVRAAVEYKLHGEPGLKRVIDPCGEGPFAFQRFVFEGVDCGFQLKSTYDGRGYREVLIFVEKEGTPFRVDGRSAGEALPKSPTAK